MRRRRRPGAAHPSIGSAGGLLQIVAVSLNALLRLGIVAFLAETLAKPHDPRFEGKAIPIRNAIIVGGLSLLVPGLHWRTRRRRAYPVWGDNVFLSIFWLDMAGNSFDLYDRYANFDLIPHFHGTGAASVAMQAVLEMPPTRAIVATNLLHLVLEAQEYATDVFFGTHNVRGKWDTAGDLLVGFAGTLVYSALYESLTSR
jgi:hypothetical protein